MKIDESSQALSGNGKELIDCTLLRTEIIPGPDSFRYVMCDVTPDGVEDLAVETEFTRA